MIIPFSNKQNDVFLSSQLDALKAQVLEDVLVAKPLHKILKRLCLSTEELVKDGVASVKMLDDNHEFLSVFVAPSLSKSVVNAINRMPLDEASGSCANAVLKKQSVYVNDVALDDRWNNSRHVSEKFGIGASWSSPVYKDGDVIGTFEISSFEKREASELQQQLVETASHLIGLAIEQTEARNHRSCSETAFNFSSAGLVVTDNDGMIFRTNGTFSQMTGVARERLIDVDLFSLLFSDTSQHAITKRSLADNKFWHGEISLHSAQGEIFPALVYINSVMSERGDIEQYVAEIFDISLLKVSQDRLKHVSHHDLLTNLPNRFSFENHLKESLRSKAKKAVLLIDVDNFKAVNNDQGHSIGDVLLKQIAIRLLECMRADDMVARFGGDKFISLLTYSEGNDLKVLASRINQALSKPYLINGRTYNNSVSIGVALIPNDSNSAVGVIKLAESAMLKAKNLGKNRFCFYSKEEPQEETGKSSKEVALSSAIKNEELYVVYQPKFDTSEKIVGVEALLRWQSKDFDFVLPDEFIPLAEKSGFIIDLGLWSLMTACQQVKKWHEQGKNITLSINVSAVQLTTSFADELFIILQEVGYKPELLELEITEEVFLKKVEQDKSILNHISDLGVRISIDGFNTGYSSRENLKDLPVDTIKIAPSIVRKLPTDKNSQAVTTAIVEMGRAIDASIAVEGVETKEQLTYLKDAGCDCFQGYLLGKPVPYDKFLSFVEECDEKNTDVKYSDGKCSD